MHYTFLGALVGEGLEPGVEEELGIKVARVGRSRRWENKSTAPTNHILVGGSSYNE